MPQSNTCLFLIPSLWLSQASLEALLSTILTQALRIQEPPFLWCTFANGKNGRLVAQLCLILCNRMDCRPPGSSFHGFPRQEYWSGLPFPSPGSLIDPGIKIASFTSPVLASESSTTSTTWKVWQIAHSLLKLQPRNDRYYFCLYFYFTQGWGNRLLEGTNKLLCAPRPR